MRSTSKPTLQALPQILVKYWWAIALGLLVFPLGILPLRLWIAAQQSPIPQAVLVLGGDPKREEKAAKLAKYYSNLDIWISSGPDAEKSQEMFRTSGIPEHRLHIDNRASDTLTNFTTLVDEFQSRRFQHLYLITSDFHMARSKAIATFVLGSRGITFTPISVGSDRPQESSKRVTRDIGRALFWLYTGWAGPEKDSPLLNLN
jgi:uncharacterized SAM-binding protein YcdF (DUF218 family)